MCLCPRLYSRLRRQFVTLRTSRQVNNTCMYLPFTPLPLSLRPHVTFFGKVDGQDFLVNLYFFTSQNGISVSQIVAKMEGHV